MHDHLRPHDGERWFGVHACDNGGIDQAVRRAARAGMSALQIFTTIPKYYGDKQSVRPERIERFRRALHETGMHPNRVLVHAAYVLNTATADEEKWSRASAGLTKELERSTALGLTAVCFHPGAATSGDRDAAAARVATAITRALETVPGPVRLFVENTAGAGTTMGRTPEEIGGILSSVPRALRHRTGYGLDTCHLFSAGYNIAESPAALASVLDAFESVAGEPPSFFHLNDSAGPLGSNVDRHVLIGEGQIGAPAFGWLLHDHRTVGIPLILETPQKNEEIADDDTSPDPYDVRMIELLQGMA